jgi:hypothetical protein
MRLPVCLLLPMVLAACGAPRAVVPPPPVERSAPPACTDALSARGAAFDFAAVPVARRGCALVDGISLRRTPMAVEPAATLSCPFALALVAFDAQVIQPAAIRHFGRPAATLRHIGAYSCRARSGGSGRLSQHAAGLAIDIAGFEIEGGPRVTCESFGVVLTPNHDVWHADHLHIDTGRDRLCGM